MIALEAERRAEPSRSIFFIVHSLGGIIVNEMLRRSGNLRQRQVHFWEILNSTICFKFFGTPHSGADPRGILQRIVEKVVKAVEFSIDEQIVNSLLPSTERLKELRDDFSPKAQNWMIHSFQEQFGITALGGQQASTLAL